VSDDPCAPKCDPFFVGYYEYTARCPVDSSSEAQSVTVRRQARSKFSQEHATALARELAKAEAEAELRCYTATACVTPVCDGISAFDPICREASSNVSQDAAYAAALGLAATAAEAFCAALP
jgi:hypothetical protein